MGLVQNDIKRVIAYSTCSQLGYMFVAAGLAFTRWRCSTFSPTLSFKAMLFLGAGSVIHAMHHEQDMRNYGGLRKKIPYTFAAMLIGTLAITGVGIPLTYYGFAGFLSKDAVIESAFAFGGSLGNYAFWMLVIAAAFTSFYSWRLMFLTFFGAPRGDHHTHEHAHESPVVMLIPLGALAFGAVFAGMIWIKPFFGHPDEVGKFFGVPYAEAQMEEGNDAADDGTHHYVFTGAPGEGAIHQAPNNTVLNDAHDVPKWVKVAPFIAMLGGLLVAYIFYIAVPSLPARWAEVNRPLYLFLLNKWYFDEIYDAVFVRPAQALGRFLWKFGDTKIIDGGINGLALGIIPFLTRLAGRAQSGYVFHYAFAMVLGVVALITWVSLSIGG